MAAQLCLGRSMLILWSLGLCFLLPNVSASVIPALFVFGDSLMDPGNDGKLFTVANANHPPYGRDFVTHRPSGRFCNGLLTSDFVATLAGLPYPPAYLVNPNDILQGTSFASTGAGIINRTGYQQGQRLNFYRQVALFSSVRTQLITLIGPQQTSVLLSKSVLLIAIGSNDYLSNYFGNPFGISTSQRKYTPEQFIDLLMSIYEQNLLELYNLGARKFVLVSLSVIGCIPLELFLSGSINGTCFSAINDEARKFNAALLLLSQQLQKSHSDARFVYFNTYDILSEMISDPPSYGFVSGSWACCGSGPYGGLSCFERSPVCENASQYVFWDLAHPTQAANEVIAKRLWGGAVADVNPMNLMQLANV